MKFPVFVDSEVAPLKKVIVHFPDDGIEVVTPNKALEFLYDDIVYLDKMREEHGLFWDTLSAFIGRKNVYDTEKLLQDVLKKSKEAKRRLINYIVAHEECTDEIKNILMRLPIEDLVYTLFTGFLEHKNKQIFPPLPNYIFTRDIAAIVKDYVIICQASKDARTRENIITRCIIYYHPIFKSTQEEKIIDLTKYDENVTLEGGDLMMIYPSTLLVGCSERSTPEAFEVLKKRLFDLRVVERVVKVEIPKDRACMHIDTIFTQISNNEFVCFKPFTLQGGQLKISEHHIEGGKPKTYSSLDTYLKTIIPDIEFILCGNDEYPFDEREQWTDGCNLVALKDGVAIAYDRNERTLEALENKGYKIIDAASIVTAYKSGIFHPEKIKKTIITVPSTELSRARGGPHCMTFPVQRIPTIQL